jgi:uncharacterized protein
LGRPGVPPGIKKSRLGIVILLVLLLLAAPLMFFRLFENQLIFHPEHRLMNTPDRLDLDYEEVRVRTEDGLDLHAWYLPAQPASSPPLAQVLFLHGNSGNISHFLDKTAGLARRGLSVLSLDYRGYGHSQGRPSEQGTYADARAAYRYLVNRPEVSPEDLVVFGYSLGGAVAVNLVLEEPVRALILESTFTSIRDMGRTVVPFLPSFVISPVYESLARMPEVRPPTLFIHGEQDEVVPVDMGRRLFAAHPGPKQLLLIPKAGHTDVDLVGGQDYYQRIIDFIQAAKPGPKD